jgi:hypothetical protein
LTLATPTQIVAAADTWTPVASAPSLLASIAPRITATGTGMIGVRVKDATGKVEHESFGPSPQTAGVPSAGSTVEVMAHTAQTISLSIAY